MDPPWNCIVLDDKGLRGCEKSKSKTFWESYGINSQVFVEFLFSNFSSVQVFRSPRNLT